MLAKNLQQFMIKQSGEDTDYLLSAMLGGATGLMLGSVGGSLMNGRRGHRIGSPIGLGLGTGTGLLLEYLMREDNPLTASVKWRRKHEEAHKKEDASEES